MQLMHLNASKSDATALAHEIFKTLGGGKKNIAVDLS